MIYIMLFINICLVVGVYGIKREIEQKLDDMSMLEYRLYDLLDHLPRGEAKSDLFP